MAGKGKIKSKGSILVICAHSDDQIIGAGGAIAKYAREGYDIHTIILSFGESVKPHLRREVISKVRIKEAQKADKIIGGKGVVFLGLNSELYMFEVWHLLNLKKRSKPKLVIDTSDTFKTKIAALKAFKSQIDLFTFYNYLVLNNFFFFLIYIKDTLNGIKYSTKYAEVFYKVR